MYSLEKPIISYAEVLDACISGVTDPIAKLELSKAKLALLNLAADYDRQGNASALYALNKTEHIYSDEFSESLKKLYSGQFRRLNALARDFYNKLVNSVPHKRCPMCGVGTVTTLDHYLPISKFSHFSVLPLNLLPACKDCNTNKLSRIPVASGEQTLHCYFDNFEGGRWLHAVLNELEPPVISYYVAAPITLGPFAQERLSVHLQALKLHVLFSSNASNELSVLFRRMKGLNSIGGSDAVRAYLIEESRLQCSIRVNSWQTAMYFALAESEWFITRCSSSS